MKIKVVIIAGQSNALGISPISELTCRDSYVYDNVLIYCSSNVITSACDKLQNLRLGCGADESKFGLEIGVGEQLEAIGKYCIIKYASDGTSLFDRWNATSGGADYLALKDTISRGKQLLSEKYEVEIVGLLWMQGENDASYFNQADSYEQNLLDFITRLRLDLQISDLPIAIGQTNPNNSVLKYVARVNCAQKSVAKRLKGVCYVPTDDISGLIDNYHYSASEEIKLGRRMINAIIDKKV